MATITPWHLITDPSQLQLDRIEEIEPRYIFFPHWSEKVPPQIFQAYECICFHETALPYGRGGSPIQNLIARGKTETVICALRMIEELDAGPIYLKRPLALTGSAREIFNRAAQIMAAMIGEIVATEPQPIPQTGAATVFKRRTPDQSRISSEQLSLEQLFDHIRMLDAEGYPHAFIEAAGFRFEFTGAQLADALQAQVRITKINGEKK